MLLKYRGGTAAVNAIHSWQPSGVIKYIHILNSPVEVQVHIEALQAESNCHSETLLLHRQHQTQCPVY